MQFFVPLKIPRSTSQQKGVDTRGRKPRFYDRDALKKAKALYRAALAEHVPLTPIGDKLPISLLVRFVFAKARPKKGYQWKVTRPDCSNMIKAPEDCMTDLNFWGDDAQIADLRVQKIWGPKSGIFVRILKLNNPELAKWQSIEEKLEWAVRGLEDGCPPDKPSHCLRRRCKECWLEWAFDDARTTGGNG